MSAYTIPILGFMVVVLLGIIRARGRDNARLAEKNGELGAALNRSERNARESEAASKKQIERLKHEIANLLEVPPEEPLRKVGAKVRLAVLPDGSEVFLPLLDPRRVYQITIHGTCKFAESTGWFSHREGYADVLYRTDEAGNFLQTHDCLKLAGVSVRRFLRSGPPEAMCNEDRNAHRYTFRIDGIPKKISASFPLEFEQLRDDPSGALTLTIEVLPEGTPSPASGERRDEAAREKAQEVERAARESVRQAEQAAKENSALRAKLESLLIKARCESHFLDEEFQRDFAKHDPAQILKVRRPEWRKEYSQFMSDAPLKNLAEKEAPEIIAWFKARMEIDHRAERLMVAPPEPPKELTDEEVRAEMIQKKAVRYKNMIAEKKLKVQMITEGRVALDEIEGDEDDKEDLKADLREEIRDDERGPQNGENNETL